MFQQIQPMEKSERMSPNIRKKGAYRGKPIGHFNVSVRIDVWNKLLDLREDLDMEHMSKTDFILFIITFVQEHFSKSGELEVMKSGVAQAIKKRDIKDIANMADEEMEERYKQMVKDGMIQEDENENG
jgi:hypothetical protein